MNQTTYFHSMTVNSLRCYLIDKMCFTFLFENNAFNKNTCLNSDRIKGFRSDKSNKNVRIIYIPV